MSTLKPLRILSLPSCTQHRLCLLLLLAITSVFLVLGLLEAPTGFYVNGDPGDPFIYMGTSQMVLQGKALYADVFYAHPPGLIAVTVGLGRLGMGMADQSYVFFGIGLALSVAVAWFARWVGNQGWLTFLVSLLITQSSVLFFGCQSQIMTNTPAALMVVLAVALAMRENWVALSSAAVFIVVAALFRLQSLAILPGLVFLNWIVWGWRRGTVRSVVLVMLAVLLHVLVTAGLEARYPGYLNAVYGSQVSRGSISLGYRALRVHYSLKSPEILLGLFAALGLTASPNLRLRGVAVLALTTTFFTVFGAKSLWHHYFLLPLPFCVVCLAVRVGGWLDNPACRWPVLACVVLLATQNLYEDAIRVRSGRRLRAEYARRLSFVRQTPERIVLASPRYVVLGGKTFPDDYWAADCFMPRVQGLFDEWLERLYAKSEAVIIDEAFANQWVTARTYGRISQGNKPIYFVNAEARRAWESRADHPRRPGQ